jgi:trehalose-6-phosphatase
MPTYTENPNQKLFCVDFDGTLTKGGYSNEPEPEQSVIDRVNELFMQGHIIIIWTARQWDAAPFLVGWLTKYSVYHHGIKMAKGGSDYYLDDKMIDFNKFYTGEF